MSSEWSSHQLVDLASFKYGKFLPKSELQDSGFPVFSGYGVVGFLPSYQFSDPQLLIVCRGEGGTGDVKMSPSTCSITNLSIVISPNEDKVSKEFLYWALKASDTHQLRTGSAQAQIVIGSLNNFKVSVPDDKGVQVEIASILDSLDDRIALLRKTNATLEAIAQAMFKSWFVDFDPVHSKQQAIAPKDMDEVTSAHFPDGFEESILGLIPSGWHIGTLGDILSLRNERVKPSSDTALLPYVPIECISSKVPFLENFKSGDEANSSLTLFKKGDILFGAMRPYFHKVCITPFDGVTRTTVFTLKARNEKCSAYALVLAFQESTIQYATQHSEGSTIPYAKWNGSLEKMPIVIPNNALQEIYSDIVSSLILKANQGIQQIQTLTSIRDTLLPRLISGQLRLQEAEALLEEITP
jgi:type I restriction enzyme S subunit